ncbi:MAG: hypothetical protein OH319_05055 [Candidatus Parvarchaeota archaeon]|nr:hypothetical protein [Candidatus Jingweiarchaeum tengchongense]MCW1297704.1 hypothetical protein [Candidatus Jingweiarchaeum tengchongense]MCW1299715.1 hypothetical protein [Candidatus Jingweiarchaeum tengchongense]MCW1304317.1 hypothetical protein [Candidatus Jingweiarchaeum tengchongense]MCW1305700.1 hypothetical protein [Candidatus Jingweiarchaeum tengchongense]
MIKKCIFSIVILLLLITPACAVNFKLIDISTESDVVPPGKIFLTKLDIKNFDTRSAYVFVKFKVNDDVYEQGQILYLPSLVEIFPAFYVPAPKEPGFFKLEAIIYDYQNSSNVSKMMIVKPLMYDFAVSLYPIKNGTFSGENTSFVLEMANIGNYNDVYTIDLYGWDNFKIENSKVSLYANSKKDIRIDVYVPPETKKGIYTISAKVCSITTQVCKIVESNLSVVASEKEQNIVRLEQTTSIIKKDEKAIFSFSIRNKGNSNKNYLILVEPALPENETWDGELKIEPNSFVLKPNEEMKIGVEIEPKKIGNFSFSYQIFSNGVMIDDGVLSFESVEVIPIGYAIANIFKPSPTSILIALVLIIAILLYLRWRGVIFKSKGELVGELEPITEENEKTEETPINFPQEK